MATTFKSDISISPSVLILYNNIRSPPMLIYAIPLISSYSAFTLVKYIFLLSPTCSSSPDIVPKV